MAQRDVTETTEAPAPVERVTVAPGELTLPERVLALQRAVGNAAVARMLARQAAAVTAPAPALPPGVKEGAERVELTELKFALIFSGGGKPLYQTQARRFVRVGMADHQEIDAGSLQEAMSKMLAYAKLKEVGGNPVRIAEIQIIAHANDRGQIWMPLVPGREFTTVDEFARLQDAFAGGQFGSFQDARAQLLPLIDENTDVIVRGCRVGAKVQVLADAFAAFFGGQAKVYLAKQYQGFDRLRIGGPVIKDAVQAYDFLESRNFIPYGTAYDDDGKKAWVRKNLPDGYVPEMFMVSEEDSAKFHDPHARGDDPALQALKEYDAAQAFGDEDVWREGHTSPGPDDPELDELSAKEIVDKAADYLAQLRAAEARSDDDWKTLAEQMGVKWPPDVLAWYTIGEKAWWVLRCDKAWRRKPEASQVKSDNRDPIAGLLTMPGLVYDTMVLAGQAAKRPDLRIGHTDAFETADIGTQPADVPLTNVSDDVFPGRPAPVTPSDAGGRGARGGGGSGGGARAAQAGGDSTIVLPADTIHPQPEPPTVSLILNAPKSKGGVNDPILVRGQFTRTFEFKFEPPREIFGGWLIVKKADIRFSGKVDFKGEGKQKILVGGLANLITDPGGTATSGGGTTAGGTIAEGKTESGVFGKLEAGGEITGVGKSREGAQTDRGMKAELSVTGTVGWGWTSTKLKIVLVGIDETKSVGDQIATGTGPFKILGLRHSITLDKPVVEIPLTDGTTATFTGSVEFGVEAEPDWNRVADAVGKHLGRQVTVGAGAVAAGEGTIATGLGAMGAGEFVVVGGALAGTALLLYAYYSSVQAIEQLKDLQTTARQGVDDFLAGYMTALGFTPPVGDASSVAGKEGSRHAEALIKDKLRVWRAREKDSDYKQRQRDLYNKEAREAGEPEWPANKPYVPPKLSDDDLLGAWKQTWQGQGYEKISRAVLLAYETAIRTQIYEAFKAQFPGQADPEKGATKADEMNARARAGIPVDGDLPSDQPDLGWLPDLVR